MFYRQPLLFLQKGQWTLVYQPQNKGRFLSVLVMQKQHSQAKGVKKDKKQGKTSFFAYL